VVDLVGEALLRLISGPSKSARPDFRGRQAVFTAEGAGRFDTILRRARSIWSRHRPERTHMIFVSNDGRRIVTSNVSSATMTILDP
jgi:hypothetical protein